MNFSEELTEQKTLLLDSLRAERDHDIGWRAKLREFQYRVVEEWVASGAASHVDWEVVLEGTIVVLVARYSVPELARDLLLDDLPPFWRNDAADVALEHNGLATGRLTINRCGGQLRLRVRHPDFYRKHKLLNGSERCRVSAELLRVVTDQQALLQALADLP